MLAFSSPTVDTGCINDRANFNHSIGVIEIKFIVHHVLNSVWFLSILSIVCIFFIIIHTQLLLVPSLFMMLKVCLVQTFYRVSKVARKWLER